VQNGNKVPNFTACVNRGVIIPETPISQLDKTVPMLQLPLIHSTRNLYITVSYHTLNTAR